MSIHGASLVVQMVKNLPANARNMGLPNLCDPMDCTTSGFPVLHQLPEFTQTHVYRVGDAIQPETRVATREESGVLGFPSRRGLTPRGSLTKDRKTGKRKSLFPGLGKVEKHIDTSTSEAI